MAPIRPRGPITTSSPITASGPISAVGSILAEAAMTADGWMPGLTGGWRMEQRRDPRPGGQRIGRDDRDGGCGTWSFMSGCTITAAAWVAASAGRYLRLFRQKLTSSPVAAASGATRCSIELARRRLGPLPIDARRIDDGCQGMRTGAPKEAGIARQRRAVPP